MVYETERAIENYNNDHALFLLGGQMLCILKSNPNSSKGYRNGKPTPLPIYFLSFYFTISSTSGIPSVCRSKSAIGTRVFFFRAPVSLILEPKSRPFKYRIAQT